MAFLKLENVLSSKYDRRLSWIDALCKAQLIRECILVNIDASGVKNLLVQRLKAHYSEDHMVSFIKIYPLFFILLIFFPRAQLSMIANVTSNNNVSGFYIHS